MSLIALPAFLRRREDTPMPETTETVTAAESTNAVVMRFLTQGGAVIELYEHAWTEHWPAYNGQPEQSYEHTGFNWTCRGCDVNGRDDCYSGIKANGYIERRPFESRREANEHAAACWSMSKPEA